MLQVFTKKLNHKRVYENLRRYLSTNLKLNLKRFALEKLEFFQVCYWYQDLMKNESGTPDLLIERDISKRFQAIFMKMCMVHSSF